MTEPAAKLEALVRLVHCERCSAPFTAKRADARYCGKRCRNAASRERKLAAPEGRRWLRVCAADASIDGLIDAELLPAWVAENDAELGGAIGLLLDFLCEPAVARALQAEYQRMMLEEGIG